MPRAELFNCGLLPMMMQEMLSEQDGFLPWLLQEINLLGT